MRNWTMVAAAAVLALTAGCKKTSDGRVVVEHPGDVKITAKTESDTFNVPQVHVGTTTDTINTPTVNVGTKKTVVRRPTIGVTKH